MAEVIFKYDLGDEVEHTVTKFKGVVTSRTQFLNGCKRYGLLSPKLKDGKPIDIEAFDEGELVLVKNQRVAGPQAETATRKAPGGPQRNERKLLRRS